MKKLKITLLALIITTLFSCSSSASFLASRVYIGMPIADFITLSDGRAKVERIENGMTVYRADDTNGTPNIVMTKFFYFDSSGKLTKMDGGEKQQTRQQIEIIRK